MAPADDVQDDRPGKDTDARQTDPSAGRPVDTPTDEPPLTRLGEVPPADSSDDDYEPV